MKILIIIFFFFFFLFLSIINMDVEERGRNMLSSSSSASSFWFPFLKKAHLRFALLHSSSNSERSLLSSCFSFVFCFSSWDDGTSIRSVKEKTRVNPEREIFLLKWQMRIKFNRSNPRSNSSQSFSLIRNQRNDISSMHQFFCLRLLLSLMVVWEWKLV